MKHVDSMLHGLLLAIFTLTDRWFGKASSRLSRLTSSGLRLFKSNLAETVYDKVGFDVPCHTWSTWLSDSVVGPVCLS